MYSPKNAKMQYTCTCTIQRARFHRAASSQKIAKLNKIIFFKIRLLAQVPCHMSHTTCDGILLLPWLPRWKFLSNIFSMKLGPYWVIIIENSWWLMLHLQWLRPLKPLWFVSMLNWSYFPDIKYHTWPLVSIHFNMMVRLLQAIQFLKRLKVWELIALILFTNLFRYNFIGKVSDVIE